MGRNKLYECMCRKVLARFVRVNLLKELSSDILVKGHLEASYCLSYCEFCQCYDTVIIETPCTFPDTIRD